MACRQGGGSERLSGRRALYEGIRQAYLLSMYELAVACSVYGTSLFPQLNVPCKGPLQQGYTLT